MGKPSPNPSINDRWGVAHSRNKQAVGRSVGRFRGVGAARQPTQPRSQCFATAPSPSRLSPSRPALCGVPALVQPGHYRRSRAKFVQASREAAQIQDVHSEAFQGN